MARWRRKLLRWALGLVGLVVILVVVVLLALAHLGARPMKGWVVGAAAGKGIVLDYDVGKVTIGGVGFAGVKIASPAADAAVAPDLVTIGAIEGRWSLFSKRLDDLVIRDVVLTVVRAADGTTSLDRWIAGLPKSAPSTEPSDPLSQLAGALVPAGVEAHVRIEGITLTVIDQVPPGRRLTVTGLGVKADVAGGGLTLAVGPGPVRAAVALPGGEREAVVDLGIAAAIAASGHGSATVDVGLVRQDLAPELPKLGTLISLAVAVDFDPVHQRTHVQIEKLALLDGAASLTAALRAEDVPTSGDPGLRPVVEELALRLDVPAIARAVPAALGPVEVEGEPLVVTVKDAAATPAPQGTIAVRGAVTHARWRDLELRGLVLGADGHPEAQGAARGQVRLALAALTLPGVTVGEVDATYAVAHPPGGAGGLWPLAITGTTTVGDVTMPAQRVQGVKLTADATLRGPTALEGRVVADVDNVEAGAVVHGAHVEVTGTDVALGTPPLAATGKVHVQAAVSDVRTARGLHARAVTMVLDAALAHGAPARVTATVDVADLVVPGLGAKLGAAFAGGPAHVELDLPSIALDVATPAASHGTATLAARYGRATIDGTVAGSADEVGWTLAARAPRLGPASEVVVASKGTLVPRTLRIAHDTQLQVGPTATAAVSVRGAKLHVVSHGTTTQHEATISAAIDAPSSGGHTFGSATFDVAAKVDLARGAVEVHLTGAQPAADVRLVAALDAARTIRWQVKGKLAGLAAAAAAVLPPGPDWDRLAIELEGQGTAAGIVARVVGGVPVLVADPAAALRGHEALTVRVRDVHYVGAAEARADVAAATLTADLELGATQRAVVALDVPALAAVSRGVKLGAKALAVRLDATLGAHGVAHGIDARLTVRAASASQSVVPWYPIGEPALEVTVAGDPDATLAVAMTLANPGAGTTFQVGGDVERGETTPAAGVVARNSLALDGTIEQVLDKLDGAPDKLKARGKVRVPFRVESGDLSLFRTTAQIALEHVAVELPGPRVQLTEVNGALPVVEEIVIGDGGAALVGQGEHGPFAQLRFPDYRPFAAEADYLAIGQVRVRGMAFGPVAGNARVDHDVVALDQLELAALGGKITGQCVAELRGVDTRLAFRGKLTGLRAPSKTGLVGGDPLDANLAVVIAPYRYGLEGRAEIVRIGKDQLRGLLDVWDPYHAEVAANRVRLALIAGYPKQVRLSFTRGFAGLAIELGGLAGAVRIDELRGIPIGPALAHWLAPILEAP